MKKGDTFSYVGADNKRHTLEYIEPGFDVKWHKDIVWGASGRFKLDGMAIIQVPWSAFEWSIDMGFIKMDQQIQFIPRDAGVEL